jgi:hypothetical protein
MRQLTRFLTTAALLLVAAAALADEGMWTFDNPPTEQLQKQYGFTVTPAWLDHLRLSAVRLGGGSGSFVSPDGLVLTNAHVARGQQQKLSSPDRDLVTDGYVAASRADELQCPDLEVVGLASYENVTARVIAAAPKGADEAAALTARRAEMAAITKESQEKTGLQSDVVTLYHGGEYWLYRYRAYTDVRLVFAPEETDAYFGGDDDNFTFPRHDLDMALFRVYENGQPLKSPDWLPLNVSGAREGDLVFVPGHPGSTNRLMTVAQLKMQRDHTYPQREKSTKESIASLHEYGARGPEQERQASAGLSGLENGRKVGHGEYLGLLDPNVWAAKEKEEADFRARVAADPKLQARFGQAWSLIEKAQEARLSRLEQLNGRSLGRGGLARTALSLVRAAAESQKPDAERLEGYHDSQLRRLRFRLLSPAPIYPEFEQFQLERSLKRMLDRLGPDDAFAKIALAGQTPADRATTLVNNSKLADPAVRQALLDGGPAAIAASDDPFIVMARALDPLLADQDKWEKENIDGPETAGEQLLGAARFAVYGKAMAPDATGTLRLSYGEVKSYAYNGTVAAPLTTFHGLFDRTLSFGGRAPFRCSPRMLAAQKTIDLATPLNFASTCDIIGGNSGSPVVDREGRLVGLVFDGNIESLVGRFVFDGTANRAVSVHAAAIATALRDIYGAGYLLKEMQPR